MHAWVPYTGTGVGDVQCIITSYYIRIWFPTDPVKMAWRADSRAILVRPTNDVTSLSEIIVSSLNRGSRTQLKVTGKTAE